MAESSTLGESGRAVAALTHVWDEIRRRHPDVPGVIVVASPGSTGTASLRLGRFSPRRWRSGGREFDELFIATEGFSAGPRYVLATMLHEAAHALAHARGVKDTSRAGAYHNGRFRELAEELGLTVCRDGGSGWATTHLPESTAAAYASQLAELGTSISGHRRIELSPVHRGAPRSGRALTCACTPARRLRASQRVVDAGRILCGYCRQPFTDRETTS